MNISFLYPSFLWALLFVAAPIILHLFNFRKFKKVYFSNVSLLKEIKEEIKASVTQMKARGERVPHLAAVLVGNDGASLTYVGSKVRSCE